MSVLLETPVLWILFGAALGLCLFDRAYRGTRGIFTVLSALLAIIGCAYALLLGAGAAEIVILLAFLLLNLEGWK